VTTLDTRAEDVRARAAAVQMPKLSTILVALVGLLPFLFGWTLNVVWQFVRLLVAAFSSGWDAGPANVRPKAPGGS
jgi:hypothetical protein